MPIEDAPEVVLGFGGCPVSRPMDDAVAVEHVVDGVVDGVGDGVGDGAVVEWYGLGVVTQRRGRVSVPETSLGLEELVFADEVGADAVAKPVQRGVG